MQGKEAGIDSRDPGHWVDCVHYLADRPQMRTEVVTFAAVVVAKTAAGPPGVREGTVIVQQGSRKPMFLALVGGHMSIRGGDEQAGRILLETAAAADAVVVADMLLLEESVQAPVPVTAWLGGNRNY